MAAPVLFVPPISLLIRPSQSTRSSPLPVFLPSTPPKSIVLGEPFLCNLVAPIRRRFRFPTATVFAVLPTANPERASEEKIPKWSEGAVKSFGMGELEARKLKYPTTGTEALLMGILVEGTNPAAKFLRANGIMLSKVREETIKINGKSDMYFFSPEHPPLTESAQRALDWAVGEKMKSGESGEVTTIHFLLGIWSEKDSAGHKILASLGFDAEQANELAKYPQIGD